MASLDNIHSAISQQLEVAVHTCSNTTCPNRLVHNGTTSPRTGDAGQRTGAGTATGEGGREDWPAVAA